MSDWLEAQDARVSKEVIRDVVKYKSPVVQAEWEAWQAAYFAGLSAGHQEDTAAIEREARKL